MTNNSTFFASTGTVVSATEAEQILKLAKDKTKATDERITGKHFFDEKLIGEDGKVKADLKTGDSEEDLKGMVAEIGYQLKLKTLATHLELAINAHKAAVRNVEQTTLEDYCKAMGKTLPAIASLQDYLEGKGIQDPEYCERYIEEMHEADALKQFNVKSLSKYYTLSAKAAAIGQAIHPDGAFAQAREALMECQSAPNELQEMGNTVICKNRRPSVALEKVNEIFFKLQARHRELEAETNRIKANIKQIIKDDQVEQYEAHKAELASAKEAITRKQAAVDEYNAISREQTDVKNQFIKEMSEWKNAETERLQHLKIAIPEGLTETYQSLIG